MLDFTTVSYPWSAIVRAVLSAVIAITIASCIKEPSRQKLMAIVLGFAGGTYLNGGFAIWEFPFAIAVVVCAYKGLRWYPVLGIGWLLHASWDVLHHTTGHPLLDILSTSSLECAVVDPIFTAWFFASAPDVRAWFWQHTSERTK
jgi:hypothetical protein